METTELLGADLMYFTHHACDELFFGSHRHDEYEIMYLAVGPEETFRLEDREYTIAPRSLLLIPAGRFHSIRARDSPCFHHLAVHFQKDFLDLAEQQYLLPLFGSSQIAYIENIPPVIDALMRSIPECVRAFIRKPDRLLDQDNSMRLSCLAIHLISETP